MIKFTEKHPELKDKVQILAFHDPNAKTFADLDAKMGPLKAKYWGGKDLPFPILLDSAGETLKKYGIKGFPTTILIDPDGRIVRGGNLKMLEDKLNLKSR